MANPRRAPGGDRAAPAGEPSSLESSDVAGYFAQYQYYNASLRAWFIGFGVGLPVLVLSQKHLFEKLDAHSGRPAARWLLLGVGAQILGALINKHTNWATYRDEALKAEGKGERLPKHLHWLTRPHDWYWVDIVLDVASLISFGAAAVLVASSLF